MLCEDAIFRDNPRIRIPAFASKSAGAQLLDKCFSLILRATGALTIYERHVHRQAIRHHSDTGALFIHIDMRMYSYGSKVLPDRIVWTSDKRAADSILHHFSPGHVKHDCELHVREDDHVAYKSVLNDTDLQSPFVVIEPDTNRDFFGTLRQWPYENWCAFVETLRQKRPDVSIVQIGLSGAKIVPGAIDLRGRTSFRTAALLLGESDLFVGTESGLMHAANAVGAKALILWGGITLPDYIGYPTQQTTICKYVPCAPCGRRGACPNDHVCMRLIGVDEVCEAAEGLLTSANS